ncbi:hypothetical protein RUM43_005455 [Polyplax serrata]|uniref:Uncharacterized protein n=1 Tax=Polyplax serrata TaxID=468196 RepID=A0AAN8S8M9_POLSC
MWFTDPSRNISHSLDYCLKVRQVETMPQSLRQSVGCTLGVGTQAFPSLEKKKGDWMEGGTPFDCGKEMKNDFDDDSVDASEGRK